MKILILLSLAGICLPYHQKGKNSYKNPSNPKSITHVLNFPQEAYLGRRDVSENGGYPQVLPEKSDYAIELVPTFVENNEPALQKQEVEHKAQANNQVSPPGSQNNAEAPSSDNGGQTKKHTREGVHAGSGKPYPFGLGKRQINRQISAGKFIGPRPRSLRSASEFDFALKSNREEPIQFQVNNGKKSSRVRKLSN